MAPTHSERAGPVAELLPGLNVVPVAAAAAASIASANAAQLSTIPPDPYGHICAEQDARVAHRGLIIRMATAFFAMGAAFA